MFANIPFSNKIPYFSSWKKNPFLKGLYVVISENDNEASTGDPNAEQRSKQNKA